MKHPKPADFKPESYFPSDHPKWAGRPRCTAWNSNHGRQCNKPAMVGKTKCERDGGKTPSGVESPHFKTGAYSKYLPKGLRQDYEAALADPQWLTLRREIAVIDARLAELFRDIESRQGKSSWEAVEQQVQAMEAAAGQYRETVKNKDWARMGTLFLSIEAGINSLGQIVRDGIDSSGPWVEVYGLIDQRRKLVESEAKRRIELRQTITKERALLLVGAMVEQFRQVIASFCEPAKASQIMLETGHRVQKLISAPVNSEQ